MTAICKLCARDLTKAEEMEDDNTCFTTPRRIGTSQ